jgi:cytochrome P450
VVISNTSLMVTLILVNPRLIKHLFAPEKNSLIQKSHLNKYGFTIALGNSMIMNEGEAWKNKRKVLSEIFNFDFIKRNVPKMK